jgi:hypothetical protein
MIYNNNGTTLLKLPNVIQVRTNSLSKKKECEVNNRNGNSNNNNFGFNYLQQKLPKIVVSRGCSKEDTSFDKKVKVCCNSNSNNKKGNNWFMNDMKNICFNKCSMMHKRNERMNDNVKCNCSELSTNNTNETYENNNENIIVNIKETTDESEMSDNSIFTFSLLSSKQNELQDNLDTSNYKINYDEYSFSLSDNNESMC